MIKTELITKYNKTLAFVTKKWHPWDEKELLIVRQSAPLLKFMLQKQANEVEDENIENILKLATLFNVDHVVITQQKMQFINKLNSAKCNTVPSQHLLANIFEQPGAITCESRTYLTNLFVEGMWNRFEGVITSNSKKCGLYYKNASNKWAHVKTAPRIVDKLFELGYVSACGRVPTAANPEVFGIQDVQELRMLIDCFSENRIKSSWGKKILRYIGHQTKHYRWPSKKQTTDLIIKLIGLKKIV